MQYQCKCGDAFTTRKHLIEHIALLNPHWPRLSPKDEHTVSVPFNTLEMFFLQDHTALELHGPFTSPFKAHRYAKLRGIGAYRVMTSTAALHLHDPGSFRTVAQHYR